MPTGSGKLVDEELPDLGREAVELVPAEPAQITRVVYAIEDALDWTHVWNLLVHAHGLAV
jgi:hypothetical protein